MAKRLSRKELYELVWSEPMKILAPRFGISDVGLRKACDRAEIPTPGPGHWAIFRSLCEAVGAKGNLVPDAYIAALAIEHGLELVTTDRDYARFPGLKWRHPLKG